MTQPFSDDELLAYLDEMLSVERAAECESQLRSSPELRQRLSLLLRRRDQGGHSIGEVWRRKRLSCPSRSELGSWLLDALDDDPSDYIEFHLKTIGCRACAANVDDLRQSQQRGAAGVEERRRKFFESSAGVLRSRRP
ncbi:MAG: hypothetical protein KDA75_16360 [Planctomycetaceae bacterium]|nr:hypothetical protein [Planctomycetaceae bacterium]